MIFKTHKNHIPQLKAHIKQHGATYFHGDGNIYRAGTEDLKRHSDNNATYSNQNQEEAKYRVLLTSADQVPDTVEELNKLLLNAKNEEIMNERKPDANSTVANFHVELEDEDNLANEVTFDSSVVKEALDTATAHIAEKDQEIEALKAQLAALQTDKKDADKKSESNKSADKKDADKKGE